MAQKIYDESQMATAPPNMGKNSPVPDDIKGFNGGVFWITLIWAIVNKSKIPVIAWAAVFICSCIPFINFISSVITFPLWVVMGFFGNDWAWQNNNWKSIAEFHRIQRLWAIWGFVAQFLAITFLIILAISLMGNVNKNLNSFICITEKSTMERAFAGKSFNNAKDMTEAAYAYQAQREKSYAKRTGATTEEIVLKGNSIKTSVSTQKFASRGNCTQGARNCGIYIYTQNVYTQKDNLACKFYFENGGNLIEAPIVKSKK